MASSLTVDFYGPIAFRFSDKDGAWAYVPECDYHVCNVLTDNDDVSPSVNTTFTLTGPTPGATRISTNGAPVIQLSWKNDTNGYVPGNQDCYCIFQLPLPDLIFGLRAEYVSITKPNGQHFGGYFARGLRFYYSDCPTSPAITNLSFDATYLESTQSGNVDYRIEVRYYDRNALEPRPFVDADQCSASMRQLFPPLDQWVVSFVEPNSVASKPNSVASKPNSVAPKPNSPPNAGGSNPVDCGANGFVFNDGGITP